MLFFVALGCYFCLGLAFHFGRAAVGWRDSFLWAALIWGLLVTALTETLSLFHALTLGASLAIWLAAGGGALIVLACTRRRPLNLPVRTLRARFSPLDRLLLTGCALVILAVGLLGWLTPPNNWDAMTYHLGRVVHWIQNQSVANYPTSILRQLHQSPWAEFAITQAQLLSGGDRWANLVQWFSLVGSAVGVTLVARQLGANQQGQIFAAVFAVTIPMGLLQGASAQNDYVVSFWLVCLAYFGLQLKDKGGWVEAFATGASLGLAVLTKPTSYLFALPLLAWIGLAHLRRWPAHSVLRLGLVVLIALLLNAGHYARTYALYGNPLGPGNEGGGTLYANELFSLPTTASNIVRNLGLHVGTTHQPWNAYLEAQIYQFHTGLGLETNDPRTTWPGTQFHVSFSDFEDSAGNPLPLALILVALALLPWQWRRRRAIVYFGVCLIAAFGLFAFYLRWQPWNSRLQLPLFVLWAAPVGYLFAQTRVRRFGAPAMLLALVLTHPYLLQRGNLPRPILGQASFLLDQRARLYFMAHTSQAGAYMGAVRFVSSLDCADIGLDLGGDDYEYPFWALLNEPGTGKIRLEHVNIYNASGAAAATLPPFQPCAVIVVGANPPSQIKLMEGTFKRAWYSPTVGVFVPQTGPP